MRRARTLYGEIMLITSAVLAACLLLFFCVVFLWNALHAQGDTRYRMVVAMSGVADAVRDHGGASRNAVVAANRSAGTVGGRLNLYTGGRAIVQGAAPPPSVAAAIARVMAAGSPRTRWWRTVPSAGPAVLWVLQPVLTTRRGAFVYALVEAPIHTRPPSVRDVSAVAAAGALALLLAQILWSFALRRFTGALARLTGWAEQLARGNLRAKVDVSATAELSHLAGVLQGMAYAVAEERDRRVAFLGEVAHDLRTPLTVQRTVLEEIASGTEAPRDTARLAAQAQAETERLIRLVNDLLDLAALEHDPRAVERQPIDLREPAALAAAGYQVMAQRRSVDLRVTLDPRPVRAVGDADRVAQVVGNLLDNAVRETPAGGRVEVTVHDPAGGAGVTVEVSDSGPGLPADVAAAIGVGPARMGARPAGRHGLGLAISGALVRAMDGRIAVLDGPGGRIRVTLPRAES